MASERTWKEEYGGVAQLGEHLPCKQGVDSSILFISTSAEAAQPRHGGEAPQPRRERKFVKSVGKKARERASGKTRKGD